MEKIGEIPKKEEAAEGARVSGGGEIVEVTKFPESQPDIEVTFLYVTHSAENAEDIWERAKDADLILLEYVDSETEKAAVERRWNESAKDVQPQGAGNEEAKRWYLQALGFMGVFSEKVAGSGKEIKFIDVSEEKIEEIEAEVGAAAAIASITELVDNGEMEKALEQYPDLIEKLVAENARREQVVVRQVQEHFKEAGGEKKVVVIQGAVHTPTYHTIKKDQPLLSAKYSFVPSPSIFSPMWVTCRKRKFLPGRRIGDEEYRRSFLGEFLVINLAHIADADPDDVFAFANELSLKLSTNEVNDTLDKFSREQQERAAKVDKIRHSEDEWTATISGRVAKRHEASKLATEIVAGLAKKHNMEIPGRIDET